MNKAQEVSEWYARLAKNNNGFKFNGNESFHSPDLYADLEDWTINPPKPKVQKIDLSVCIESGIDMEFSDTGEDWFIIRKLKSIAGGHYIDSTNTNWRYCRVRQNHPHAWSGGECPIPQELKGIVLFRDGSKDEFCSCFSWANCGNDGDIIQFTITGTADNFTY